MKLKKRWVWLSVVALVTVGVAGLRATSVAGDKGVPGTELQKVLEAALESAETQFPGVLMYVSGPELGTWTGAAGLGDIKTSIPMRPDDKFRAGSIMKTFVSVVTLQLVEEGLFSLNDTLTSVLPESVTARFPNSDQITVRMLLNHTGGIPDFLTEAVYGEIGANPTKIWTDNEWLDLAAEQEPYFSPGEGWHYSNTDYILIGLIIEGATGRSWRENVRQRVIEPLKLGNTLLPEPGDLSIPGNHSRGYHPMNDALLDLTDVDPSMAGAAGGSALVTNAGDLAQFLDALLAGELLENAETLDDMLTFVEAQHPSELPYDYGLAVEKFTLPSGVEMMGHAGGTAGFASVVYYLPALETTVAAMVNTQDLWGLYLQTLIPAIEVLAAASS